MCVVRPVAAVDPRHPRLAIDVHAATIVAALDRLDTIVLVLGPPEQPGGVGTILAANTAFGRRVGGDPTHRNLGTLMLPETDQGSVDAVACIVVTAVVALAANMSAIWCGVRDIVKDPVRGQIESQSHPSGVLD